MHPQLDQLQPLLQDAAASNPEADRCLCHPVGTPQVQADASPDQRRERLVRPNTPGQPNTLCPLGLMSRQRPNIGSRVVLLSPAIAFLMFIATEMFTDLLMTAGAGGVCAVAV